MSGAVSEGVSAPSQMLTSGLAGTVRFQPRIVLTESQAHDLRDAFVERTECESAENGAFLLDWVSLNSDGPPYHTREVVGMWRDGGDDEDPWVVFYRLSGEATTLHVPPPDVAKRLAEEAAWMMLTPARFAAVYDEATTYLSDVLNNSAKWQPLTEAD